MSTEPQDPQVSIPEPPVVTAPAESDLSSHVENWMHWVEDAIAKLRQHVTVLVGNSSAPAEAAPASQPVVEQSPTTAEAVQPPVSE